MDFRARELDFQEADRRYADLQRQHSRGAITDKVFDEQLRQLMVQDEEGVWWAKSIKSGRWHYYDGTAWIPRSPPGYQPDHEPAHEQTGPFHSEDRAQDKGSPSLQPGLSEQPSSLPASNWRAWNIVTASTILLVVLLTLLDVVWLETASINPGVPGTAWVDLGGLLFVIAAQFVATSVVAYMRPIQWRRAAIFLAWTHVALLVAVDVSYLAEGIRDQDYIAGTLFIVFVISYPSTLIIVSIVAYISHRRRRSHSNAHIEH